LSLARIYEEVNEFTVPDGADTAKVLVASGAVVEFAPPPLQAVSIMLATNQKINLNLFILTWDSSN